MVPRSVSVVIVGGEYRRQGITGTVALSGAEFTGLKNRQPNKEVTVIPDGKAVKPIMVKVKHLRRLLWR